MKIGVVLPQTEIGNGKPADHVATLRRFRETVGLSSYATP